VFGTEDAVFEDEIIAGYLRAEQDGVDIITASIINYNGWEDEAWALVGSRLVERGIIVVNAAGNYGGSAGPFLHSTGASGKYVLSAASIDASERAIPAFNATFNLPSSPSNTTKFAYYYNAEFNSPWPTTVSHFPVIPLSLNTTTDNEACEPLPEGTPIFTGSEIVLVRRGGCFDLEKQNNLEALGARFILLYNPDSSGDHSPFLNNSALGLGAVIDTEPSLAIVNTIKAGGNVSASCDITTYIAVDDPTGGRPSQFTSWGALPDLKVKPDIAAPGGNIFSTALGGGYETQSGTSQAAPYIAGVVALWIGKYGGR